MTFIQSKVKFRHAKKIFPGLWMIPTKNYVNRHHIKKDIKLENAAVSEWQQWCRLSDNT